VTCWQQVVTLQNVEKFTVFFGADFPGKIKGLQTESLPREIQTSIQKRAGHETCQQTTAT
jgi:hypothetical protein